MTRLYQLVNFNHLLQNKTPIFPHRNLWSKWIRFTPLIQRRTDISWLTILIQEKNTLALCRICNKNFYHQSPHPLSTLTIRLRLKFSMMPQLVWTSVSHLCSSQSSLVEPQKDLQILGKKVWSPHRWRSSNNSMQLKLCNQEHQCSKSTTAISQKFKYQLVGLHKVCLKVRRLSCLLRVNQPKLCQTPTQHSEITSILEISFQSQITFY